MTTTNEPITIGAGLLVKSSAKKIYFLRKNSQQSYKETPGNILGDKYADIVTKGYKEMRGTYRKIKDGQEFIIYYPFDEIRVKGEDKIFIEHKYVRDHDNVEDWFLQSSLVQLAFMVSLFLINKNKEYVTAYFSKIKEGKSIKLTLDPEVGNNLFILNFGGRKFQLTIKKPKYIVGFFVEKLVASVDFRDAKQWDELFKYQDYEKCKKYFDYKKWKPLCTTTKASSKTTREKKSYVRFHATIPTESKN